jgi:hypothetical protein
MSTATRPAAPALPRVSLADRKCADCGATARVIIHLHPLSGTRDVVCECPGCGESWSVGE